jgi:hypothetical protein
MKAPIAAGIMQPYFLPYIGYWQLINAVDKFGIYDNIKFTKRGWINRNYFLQNGKEEVFSLPLKKDSDYLDINQRVLCEGFPAARQKLLRRFEAAYRRAPNYIEGMDIFSMCLLYNETNLFQYLLHSIKQICLYLDIKTELIVSSTLGLDHSLRGQERVIATCKALGATDYLNPVGGVRLYDTHTFAAHGINLSFQNPPSFSYAQFRHEFIPNLSIIDVIMFNDRDTIKRNLTPVDPPQPAIHSFRHGNPQKG